MTYRLGVDLGTTFSSAAVARNGHVEVVPLGDHSNEMPSVVYLGPAGEVLVGEAAVARELDEPERVAREFKRRFGDDTDLFVGGTPISPHALTGILLSVIVETVTAREGSTPDKVVVTCPANWGPYRRELLENALDLAGTQNAVLITEPEAAALHFGAADRLHDGDVVAVYDLGGGTFDSALLRKQGDALAFVGEPEGIERLGGLDFDAAVIARVSSLLDLGDGDYEAATSRELSQLRDGCVRAKELLSHDVEAAIPVGLPGAATSVRLTRSELEALISRPIDDTVDCLERAMGHAGIATDELAAVLLVGGSARIPLVRERLTERLGRPLAPSPQPKLCVAMGAALFDRTEGEAVRPPSDSRASTEVETQPAAAEPSVAAQTVPGPTVAEPRAPASSTPKAPRARTIGRAAVYAAAALLLFLLGLLAAFGGQDKPASALEWDRESAQVKVPGPLLDSASMELRVLGITVPGTTVERGGTRRDPTFALGTTTTLFLTGPVHAFVQKDLSEPVDMQLVPVSSSWWRPVATLPGGLMVLAALYSLAYGESLLRGLRRRRGRVRAGDLMGMTGTGAILGLAIAIAAWASGRLPTGAMTGLTILCLAAAAGLLTFAVAAAVAGGADRRSAA